MTDLEKRARQMMIRDSGPDDPSWDDTDDDERDCYLWQAVEERAYTHALAMTMARNEHGDSADETDIDWYRDLIHNAMVEVGAPRLIW